MKILIMGGTGLIGTALAQDLAKDGHQVIVLTRAPEKNVSRLPDGVQALAWDGHSAAGWGSAVDGVDAVVNLVGENLGGGRWTPERKKKIIASRVDAGRAITEAIKMATHKPSVLIQASAIGFYGLDPQKIYREEDGSGDSFENQVVQLWEESSAGVEEMGVRRVVVRMAVVLSARGGALPRLLLPFRLFAGGPLGNGKQPFAFVHMTDVVRALRFLIDHPTVQGPVNIAAPEILTNAEFARVVGRVMRRPAFVPAPAFAIRAVFGEMATVVLDGRRVSPDRLTGLGFTFRYPTAHQAIQDLV